jgi:hypothetical protein
MNCTSVALVDRFFDVTGDVWPPNAGSRKRSGFCDAHVSFMQKIENV